MKARKSAGSGKSGFTIIELMIAITVLLVAVLSTFTSQIKARDLMETSRETSIASADLQAVMERILVLPVDRIPVAASLYADGQPVAAYTNRNLRNELIVADYPGYAGAAIPDPLPIVLTLTWTDRLGRPRTMQLRSMKVR